MSLRLHSVRSVKIRRFEDFMNTQTNKFLTIHILLDEPWWAWPPLRRRLDFGGGESETFSRDLINTSRPGHSGSKKAKNRDVNAGPLTSPFARTAHLLACSALRCAHLFARTAHSLTLEQVGKCTIRCLKTTWFCPQCQGGRGRGRPRTTAIIVTPTKKPRRNTTKKPPETTTTENEFGDNDDR